MKKLISTLLLTCLTLSSPLVSDEAPVAAEIQQEEAPQAEPAIEAPQESAPYEVGAASEESSNAARNGQLKSIGIAAGVVAIAVAAIILVSRSQGRHHS
jgi:hypothetical protein